MEQAYESVKKLVEDFRGNEREFLSPKYSESAVRQGFIDKFFTALGWDVTHERQKNPFEYEVRIENSIPGNAEKKADYAFFIAPEFDNAKFYVEAKKPAKDLKNPGSFFQTMWYGWNGNTPIAILTDFEEFRIIDCRFKPTMKDALSRELESFRYTDYADEEKFRRIYWLFSREAVADGSIEKYAAKLSRTKGKAVRGVAKSQPVDEVFLAELDDFRLNLAKAFKDTNQKLDGEELTEAVQRTLDRLVFIRFLEDKSIEPEREIVKLIGKEDAWDSFSKLCKRLDPKYNGLIFKPHKVIDSEEFKPPNEKIFHQVCYKLAGPESPYNFAQIPISILGSIYERFLGKVVHSTNKRATVDDKPEVRKAGGVYYTPDYIVKYIVKETVGKLIEGKTPEEISKMAFADIACGSGSFLIEVYNILLKYHERYYADHPEKAKKGDLDEREGVNVLSLKKRQEILVNNIYGVDIDYQATEVTQLSLYLKLLENVTMNVAYQFTLLKEKILPNLGRNIVCGNSLIGTDIGGDGLFPNFDKNKLKPMDFKDVFPEVMDRGGFDAVVGNPPWVRVEELGEQTKYFSSRYHVFHNAADLYTYFVEKAISLVKPRGTFGYIVSNKWLRAEYGSPLRSWLSPKGIRELIDFQHIQVFKGATTYPCILIVDNIDRVDSFFITLIDNADYGSLSDYVSQNRFEMSKSETGKSAWVLAGKKKLQLLKKIREVSVPLSEFSMEKIYRGIITGLNEAFVIDSKTRDSMVKSQPSCAALLRPYLEGKDLKRYSPVKGGKYAIVIPNGFTRKNMNPKVSAWEWFHRTYRPLAEYLEPFEDRARKRYDKGEYWWEFRPCDYYDKFEVHKICWGNLAAHGSFTFDKLGFYVNAPACIIPINDLYMLGLMNSRLLWWYLKDIAAGRAGGFIEAKPIYVQQLPIRAIDFSDSTDKSRHDHIVSLVERMLAAKEELSKARTEAETTRLERECESLDRQIDQAVYELYGLMEEEIKVVEGK